MAPQDTEHHDADAAPIARTTPLSEHSDKTDSQAPPGTDPAGQAAQAQVSTPAPQWPEVLLDCDGVICLAMQHCDVPLLREIAIQNETEQEFSALKVTVSADPAFMEPQMFNIDRLLAGSRVPLHTGVLPLSHAFLAKMDEASRGHIKVELAVEGSVVQTTTLAVDILGVDHWPGSHITPELIGAFVLPNEPSVQGLLREASDLLRARSGQQMVGYQTQDRREILDQVAAIYTAVARRNIHYANPPATFETGQRIRRPSQVLQEGLGTCLDLTLLLAGCLEQAGLNPVLLFKEGHCWPGVWLVKAQFSSDIVDDPITVRKRLDSGELIVFESTSLTQGMAFDRAVTAGRELLAPDSDAEREFAYALEIQRARVHRIKPLPSTSEYARAAEAAERESVEIPDTADIELPPLDNDNLNFDRGEDADTPDGRVERWLSRLLDLSLRNKLLNFKRDSKGSVPMIVPAPADLEDVIASGEKLLFKPLPQDTERRSAVYSIQSASSLEADIAREALGNREILTGLDKAELDRRLTKLFRDARTARQEGGTNTLFIALGLLRWQESASSDRRFHAPILLVPVSIHRQIAQGRFHLQAHEDETVVNPTLLQMLRQNFEIDLNLDPDNLPTDESGVDVQRIWSKVMGQIQEMKGWEVVKEVHLGLFSFTKYLMWKDLRALQADLASNANVQQLIQRERNREAAAGEFFPPLETLDDRYEPVETFCPADADASQLSAIYAAAEDKSFVIEGPPGTGKSQTITNIIAHCAGAGRRVLFVSEKQTALEVVKTRLDEAGLEEFILELHSSKAGKATFAQSIKDTLSRAGQFSVEAWQTKSDELKALRDELNTYVRELHRRFPNGLTPYEALGVSIRHAGSTPSPLPWSSASQHDLAALSELRRSVEDLAQVARQVGEIAGHPLTGVTQRSWTPAWQDEFLDKAQALQSQAEMMIDKPAAMWSKLLGLPARQFSMQQFEALNDLAAALLAAPEQNDGVRVLGTETARTERLLGKLRAARGHFDQACQPVAETLDPEKLRTYESALLEPWEQANATWWPKSFFARRSVRKQLAPFLRPACKPGRDVMGPMLEQLEQVRQAAEHLKELETRAKTDELLEGPDTSLPAIDRQIDSGLAWSSGVSAAVSRLVGPGQADTLLNRLGQIVNRPASDLADQGSIGRSLKAYQRAWQKLGNAAVEYRKVLGRDYSGSSGPLADIAVQLATVQARSNQLNGWCQWNQDSSAALSLGLDAIVAALVSGQVESAQLSKHFEHSYHDWFVKKAMDEQQVLSNFSSYRHNQRIEQFRRADREFAEMTREYLKARLSGRAAEIEVPKDEWSTLGHQAQLQRAHKPIRQMVKAVPTALSAAKPILLMSPLSIAQYLEPGSADFDVLIFDEASQIPVWDAVGAMGRAKQVIVVGDPKQLPPTNFFNTSSDGNALDDGDYEDLDSILEECLAAGMPQHRLNRHYRSRHESLIAFSNEKYYGNELVTFPSPVTGDSAVEFRHVADGEYSRGKNRNNPNEARAIAEQVQAHFADPDTRKQSLGVVAFSQAQESLIADLVDKARQKDAAFDTACDGHEREPLFIKNLENSQGDERDVILFSVGYGKDATGRMTYNMGALNRQGGERRLNVAITRAREKVVIFASFRGDDMNPSRLNTRGVSDLRDYLVFAEKGRAALQAVANPTGRGYDSPFEAEVAERVRQAGYEVHTQVGVSGYRIDLGVVDRARPGRYLLGIECDGAMYHSGAIARERDRIRQGVLEGLGWSIHRIWSTDWWHDADKQTQALVEAIRLYESDSKAEDMDGEVDSESADIPDSDGEDQPNMENQTRPSA